MVLDNGSILGVDIGLKFPTAGGNFTRWGTFR
jgi:hypothetical protein